MGNSHAKQENFKDTYTKKHVLGRGSFATVYLAERKRDGEKVAIKILMKKSLSAENESKIRKEIDIMKQASHTNVVSLIDVYQSKHKIQIVLELCTGGHLLERLGKRKHYNEVEAANVIKQLALACKHMHQVGVVHRDLKPENILYATEREDSPIKITDFGLSTHVSNAWEATMMTPCGTPAYVAPEVILRRGYHCECDLWSIGVILYLLVSGFPPFYGSNLKKLLRRVTKASYDFRPAPFKSCSDEVKDVIKGLLKLDPKERLTPDNLLTNPWVNGLNASAEHLPDVSERLRRIDLARRFRARMHLALALESMVSDSESVSPGVKNAPQKENIKVDG